MRLETLAEVITTSVVLVSRLMEMTRLSKPPDDRNLRLKDPLVDMSLAMQGILHGIDQHSVIVPKDSEDFMLVKGFDIVGSLGTGHPCFNNFVKEYKRQFSHDLMVLFETRISSSRADAIIGKLVRWLLHPEFGDLIRNHQNQGIDIVLNQEKLQSVVQDWNKRVYGNIFARKKELTEELKRVLRILKLRVGKSMV
ncbi:hypothetical protein Gotur_007696 [Gossypium turneri]